MRTQRIGKIARLPLVVREELNRRLLDGESGAKVLGWINELPEVREILRVEFGGKMIGKQNLWAWRQGGYRDWVLRRDAMELAGKLGKEVEEFAGLDGKNGKSLTEMVARWVTVHFAVAGHRLVQTPGTDHWRVLRQMVADVVRLRTVEQEGRRLGLQERRLNIAEEKLALRRTSGNAKNGEVSRVENGSEAGMARVMEEMRREFFAGMSPEEFWGKVMTAGVEEVTVKAGQGESRLAREDGGRDSTQRLEGSKEGGDANARGGGGSPPRRQDAKGTNGTDAGEVAEVAVPGDQGGSRLIREDEEVGTPRRHEDSKDGYRQAMADDLFRREAGVPVSKALASRAAWELSFGEMSKREVKIYCPKCSWEPEQASRWSCRCGCEWNTFDTGGVCPDCGKVWEDTACLSCHAWSRHRDWYHEFIGGREVGSVEETRELERAI